MISLAMHRWNLVCLTGSSLGSVTTVASRDIRQQSVGVAVKHHAPTDAHLTSKPCQSRTNSKKRNKKASFHQCKVPSVIYKSVLAKESQFGDSSSSIPSFELKIGWQGGSSGKWEEKKLKNSRKALGMTRGLTGNDCMHVYNCFWGLAHNECIGCC